MTITLTETQHRLRTLAQSRPDHVDPGSQPDGAGCRYVNADGSGSCIVGTAFTAELTEAGVTIDSGYNDDGITSVVSGLEIEIESVALEYLAWAQASQDGGSTWSQAVNFADLQLAEYLAEDSTDDDVSLDADELDEFSLSATA